MIRLQEEIFNNAKLARFYFLFAYTECTYFVDFSNKAFEFFFTLLRR
jgi:hypothetical protein